MHREHIILHELSHVLCGHSAAGQTGRTQRADRVKSRQLSALPARQGGHSFIRGES